VLKSIAFLLAAQDASTATIDVHGLHEFLLAIHALELNVSISARSWVVYFVLIASF
jgi:hypothetical protein